MQAEHRGSLPRPGALLGTRKDASLIALLIAYVLVVYWRALPLPFINDDYVFLDKVRTASFLDLWKPERLYSLWYRPWSRELHYWLLSRLLGPNEAAFHVVNFVLSLTVAGLYWKLAERLTRDRFAATIAVTGVIALAAWASPLYWVAGVQELWMLLFGLLFLHALVSGRGTLACAALVLALLSKETAAVLPAIGTAYARFANRRGWRSSIRASAPYWIVVVTWALFHPTLRARFSTGPAFVDATVSRLAWPESFTRTLLSLVNLDQWPAPDHGWSRAVLLGAIGAVILVAMVIANYPPPGNVHGRRDDSHVTALGFAWGVIGSSVILLPSIGWHPYYVLLGALGFWVALATLLSRHRSAAVSFVACVALLRGGRADTPSWDWGSDWYLFRAGAILESIRHKIADLHPRFPNGSRLFFARLPNNIGLLGGDGPALRVWYGDPSLRAMFYSAYTPRLATDCQGTDYFFRFDTVSVLVEIHPGPETLSDALSRNPVWRHDHEVLASLFLHSGNLTAAADEYAKLARAAPERPDYALLAGAAAEALGDSARAETFYGAASKAYGEEVVRRRAAELVRFARSVKPTPRPSASP